MSHKPDAEGPRELSQLEQSPTSKTAVGAAAVRSSINHVNQQAGFIKGSQALLQLNQKDGFDCPSCAWPDPDGERSKFEFCENGAKAVATEITKKRVTPEFFAQHSVAELSYKSDFWLNNAGRLTAPMLLDADASHYCPVTWDQAFELLAEELNAGSDPNEAIFYTSGRASNEAAFVYQLFVRQYGTNNLPDCSNMCHESSGAALSQTIGIGKGTVTLQEIEESDCLMIMGQNPGTNHPRMLSSLEQTVKNGGKIISINPLFETGLKAFAHPQKLSGLAGQSTQLASLHLPVRINGDLAYLKGLIKCVFEAEASLPGTVLDQDFIQTHTKGFETLKEENAQATWSDLTEQSGLSEKQIREAAEIFISAKEAITCWAMGLTQHRNSVEIIREIVNLHLLTGKIGRPRSGLCPVRGHSNVQGDRTMGIWEKMPEAFLERLDKVFNFTAPRAHGYDTVDAIRAMHANKCRVFVGLGGNFLSASPDTHYTAHALRNCELTVQISTKLNRGHLITGKRALILPCLGRTEIDQQDSGPQIVSVENSMGVVQSSRGRFQPASKDLLSETAIICRMAKATLGEKTTASWSELMQNYDRIRDCIEKVLPGFEDYNTRVRQPGGFYLPNAVKQRQFKTASGKAEFTINSLKPIQLQEGQLILQTLRSHDQFNTTIYGMDDRYRGIKNERRVLFMHPDDIQARGLSPEQPVDITSHFKNESRVAKLFLVIPYDTPRGCAAAYYPETNVLIPVNSTAETSQTPTSKSIVITVEPSQ